MIEREVVRLSFIELIFTIDDHGNAKYPYVVFDGYVYKWSGSNYFSVARGQDLKQDLDDIGLKDKLITPLNFVYEDVVDEETAEAIKEALRPIVQKSEVITNPDTLEAIKDCETGENLESYDSFEGFYNKMLKEEKGG